jgi:signal transduction histidine kinase
MNQQALTADQLVTYTVWAVYVLIFIVSAVRAIRRPLRANIDIALLFGSTTIIIGFSVAAALHLFEPNRITRAINTSLILAVAYLLLRLVDDFAKVPRWLMRASEVILVLLTIATFLTDTPAPAWLWVPMVLYLILLLFYATVIFTRDSGRTSGVTRRRMLAVAIGSLSLCFLFVIAAFTLILPQIRGLLTPLTDIISISSGIAYFVGFATPNFLRAAWQEPELRAFLGRAASLPRLPTTDAIIHEMEAGAAASVGAFSATIGLWDEEAQLLRFGNPSGGTFDLAPSSGTAAGRCFMTQEPVFSANLGRDSPATAAVARSRGVNAVMVAPITAGEKRLGVLSAYSDRAPIFADEDLALVKLLADQAAVILESRALIDEAARVRAREEITRLKDDFLSAAAHDLKTPLTTLVAQTQLLERKLARDPNVPVDLMSLQRISREVQRLKSLVLELLDAARAEQGQLVGQMEQVDLGVVAADVCTRHNTDHHPCSVDVSGPVTGSYDRQRIVQLFENLIENAIKYSPGGGPVRVRVWREGAQNHLEVSDRGIGLPIEDLPHLFDRFHRGTNVNDRRFAGMGLGLYICRGITEQHGGRIWARNNPDGGSTFSASLPATAAPPVSAEGMDEGGSKAHEREGITLG